MVKGAKESGSMLTLADIDGLARHISNMWDTYNVNRTVAVSVDNEVREYINATDINTTSASILPHKNRTHIPKLAEIREKLVMQLWSTTLGKPDWCMYRASNPDKQRDADRMTKWVRNKLEARKFRETVGRSLIEYFVDYGNCFASVDYVVERNDAGIVTYRGPVIDAISPLDIVFNSRAKSFDVAPKLQRVAIHAADLARFPDEYPTAGFNADAIRKAVQARNPMTKNTWIDLLKDENILIDGYGSMEEYFNQDVVELLIYRGDVFNPETGEAQRNRIVYIVDRTFVIRNAPSPSPKNFNGLHMAGWRKRTDNLWCTGPLHNIVGLQYRINHLENLKADAFDLVVNPPLKLKGWDTDIIEPEEGYQPGAQYYCSNDADVELLVPNTQVLQADTEINYYSSLMDKMALVLPEISGVRTPGEKTAFEVNQLLTQQTQPFIDKARQFEVMLERVLEEIFELMIINYDGTDYVETMGVSGKDELGQLSAQDIMKDGRFEAVGSRHFEEQNKRTLELTQFMSGPAQDPKIRMHTNGFKLTQFYEKQLALQDEGIFEPYAGIKEDVEAKAVAQSKQQQIVNQTAEAEKGLAGDIASTYEQSNNSEGNPLPATE